eukprot:6167208-Pyramimonas_sp.AAC.2
MGLMCVCCYTCTRVCLSSPEVTRAFDFGNRMTLIFTRCADHVPRGITFRGSCERETRNMGTGAPLFPPLVPRTIEYLVDENDEDALLTIEEAKLEAQRLQIAVVLTGLALLQWATIRQAHAHLWYPGKHVAQANQSDHEPVDDDDGKLPT